MLTVQTLAPWLPAPGTTALCAVSGGLDSMCLLHILWQWCGERNIPLTAAHFHHGLRDTADRDEAFVRDWCGERGIPFTAGRGDVRKCAALQGLSLEEAARNLRYAFLREAARNHANALIYTAHHARDNAETVLLNLIRGTGLRGLAGMRHRRDGIVRPLLDVARGELEEYAAAHGLPHVEDETNADPAAAARNRVRLDLLPLLRELNPRAEEHIRETADQLREIDVFLEAEAHRRMASIEIREGQAVFPCAVLLDAPSCVRPRMLLAALDGMGAGRKDFGSVHLNAVLSHLETGGGARHLDLPHGVTARLTREALVLERRTRTEGEAELRPGVPVLWGQYSVTLLDNPPNMPPDARPNNPPNLETLSAGSRLSAGSGLSGRDRQGDSLVIRDGGGRLTVSRVRPADRLFLPGSSGSRTVKRLCLDRGISQDQRDNLPAVYADGRLAAVWRLGTDVSFLPADGPEAADRADSAGTMDFPADFSGGVRRILVEKAR